MSDLASRIALVDGKCPLCHTQVIIVAGDRQLRFIPHDDPQWCMAAALHHQRMLERIIQQNHDDVALLQQREAYYHEAYATALDLLEEKHGLDFSDEVEQRIAERRARAKEQNAIREALAKGNRP